MKPLENIVDINHSGFFTREKVRRFYRSLVQGNENFCRFAISVSTRAATTRTERDRFLVEFKCIVTDIARFFCLRSPPPWKNSENKGVSPRWTSSPVAPPLGVKRRRRPKNKQQQKRLHDEEKMKQRHHAEHNKNNTSKKILVVDDIGLCRRVRFSSLSFRSRRKERALEQKRKVPLPRVPCLFRKG